MRHRIFVGSSAEQLKLARAIRNNLSAYGHAVTVWDQGIFSIGKVALDALTCSLDRFDAAVFVFAPTDLLRIRGQAFEAVRDNVLFELGLFTGRLGRDRYVLAGPARPYRSSHCIRFDRHSAGGIRRS